MPNFSGAAQGFLDFNQNQQQQQYRQALIAEMLQNMALSKQKQDAALQQQQLQATGANLAGNALPQLSPPPAPPQNPNQPPAMPPGQASMPMQQPGQMQAPPLQGAPQGGPQMSMAPGMQPQPMPWKPMPKEPPGGGTPQPGGMQQLGPPPTPAESVRQVDGAIEGGTVIPSKKLPDPATLMQQWQKEGHTGAEIMAGLDAYMGVYSKVQQQEVEGLKLQLKFKEDQQKFKEQWLKDNREERRLTQADTRIEQADKRETAREAEAVKRDVMAEKRMNAIMAKQSSGAGGALEPEDLKFMAGQYRAGDKSVMQNLGRGVQGSKNIIALRGEIRKQSLAAGETPEHVAIRIAEFEGLKAGERTAGTREAQLGFAAHELEQFIPLAQAASEKVSRTAFLPLNRLIQMGENQWSPEQAAFVAANRAVINAFSQVASRGVPTVHNTAEAEKMLNTAGSHKVYKATLDQLMAEVKGALKAPGQVREDLADRGTKPVARAEPGPTINQPSKQKAINWNDLK
jgi:hypothetical protein